MSQNELTPSEQRFHGLLKDLIDYANDNMSIYSSALFPTCGVDDPLPSSYELQELRPVSSTSSLPSLLSSSSSGRSIPPITDYSFHIFGEFLPHFEPNPLQIQQILDPHPKMTSLPYPFYQTVIKPRKVKGRVRCDLCGKSFSRKADLRRHHNEIHKENITRYECIYNCGSTFVRKHDCQRHNRSCKLS